MKVDFHRFIESLTAMIEAKDFYTSGHSSRVAELTFLISKKMVLDSDYCYMLHIGAHLHDIGKIGIPDGILLKSSKLTCEEFSVIKTHSMIGYDILVKSKDLGDIPLIIKHHHERMDGKGYPSGLKGKQIPLGSRIIALADSFDAMVSSRPYKPVMDIPQAIEEIRACSGTQFDNDAAKALLLMLQDENESKMIEKLFSH